MNEIHPRFRRGKLGGSLLCHARYTVSADGKEIQASAAHWQFKTKDGKPDLRYNPVVRTWSISDFCKLLGKAVKLGDFEGWTSAQLDGPLHSHLSEFASVAGLPSKSRSGFYVSRGSLYTDQWPHQPLYAAGSFSDFSEAVAQLNGLRKAASLKR